uniref:Uncharacterized protein n=1 Tax=Micrurus lemniscatus lemniscatus TaxID=129467 RepID=A0A2D4IWT4_MICLE
MASAGGSKKDRNRGPSKAAQKDASRRHKALERQIEKSMQMAEKQPLQAETPGAPMPLDLSRSSHPRRAPAPTPPRREATPRRPPTATFTPTAAGLRQEEPLPQEMSQDLKAWIELAISRGIAVGVQQSLAARRERPESDSNSVRSLGESYVSQIPVQTGGDPPSPGQSHTDLREGEDDEFMDQIGVHSDQDTQVEEPLEQPMSDDEEHLRPDQPSFTGLFKPQVFKSLLFKARTIARLDKQIPDSQQSVREESEDLIFSQPTTEVDVIPVPKMFEDLLNKQ